MTGSSSSRWNCSEWGWRCWHSTWSRISAAGEIFRGTGQMCCQSWGLWSGKNWEWIDFIKEIWKFGNEFFTWGRDKCLRGVGRTERRLLRHMRRDILKFPREVRWVSGEWRNPVQLRCWNWKIPFFLYFCLEILWDEIATALIPELQVWVFYFFDRCGMQNSRRCYSFLALFTLWMPSSGEYSNNKFHQI